VTRQRLALSVIEELSSRLEDLPATELPRSAYQAVAELEPGITRALGRGQTLEAILELLNGTGIKLSRRTLQRYLRRARATRPPASGPAPADSPPVPARVVGIDRVRPAQPLASRGTFTVRPDTKL
jgi:hypothetical protein